MIEVPLARWTKKSSTVQKSDAYTLITDKHDLSDEHFSQRANLLPLADNMIKKSAEELQKSFAICAMLDEDRLIGAIWLREQLYTTQTWEEKRIYQRGSLIVEKSYRGKNIPEKLIPEINDLYPHLPIYGIACIEKVAHINQANHQIVRKAEDIERTYPYFDTYIEKVRGEKPLESRRDNGYKYLSKKYEWHRVILNQALMDILTAEKEYITHQSKSKQDL